MNLAKGEDSYENNDGWRTPDDSWLELGAGDKIMQVYHANIIMEEDNSMEERTKLPAEETDNNGENQSLEEKSSRGDDVAVQLLAKKRRLERGKAKAKKRRV